ncbi:hypothetical protein [Ensifer sp. B1-9]|uniref:hypothetical protein n=1 Tax=Ensifer sp. B1-9 TaxID=3141455 RepID=UPI003D20EFDC
MKAARLVGEADAIPASARPHTFDRRSCRSVSDEQTGTVAIGVGPIRLKRHFAIDAAANEMNAGAIAKDDRIGVDRLHTDVAAEDRVRSRVPAIGNSEEGLCGIDGGFRWKVANGLLCIAVFATQHDACAIQVVFIDRSLPVIRDARTG